jgi:hypothetical protein
MITWKQNAEMIETKAFVTFIGIYFLFRIVHLSANIKPTLYKAMITSVMNFACPSRKLAPDI